MRELNNLPKIVESPALLRTQLIGVTVLARRIGVSPYLLRHAAIRAGVPVVRLGRNLFVHQEAAVRLLTPQQPSALTPVGVIASLRAPLSSAGVEPGADAIPTAATNP